MLEAIIFDLGGVLLNLDFARTAEAFRRLGAHNFAERWTPACQDPFFLEYERGQISSEAFRAALRQALVLPDLSDADLDAAWNAMILDIPAKNLELLAALRRRYRVFLLSNTNEIHLQHVQIQLPTPNDNLERHFDAAYYSCRIGARKPDTEAFAAVMEAAQLKPHRTLFIDDSENNVQGARKTGLMAIHLAPGKTLQQVLPLNSPYNPSSLR